MSVARRLAPQGLKPRPDSSLIAALKRCATQNLNLQGTEMVSGN
jgi:hypothetical protein